MSFPDIPAGKSVPLVDNTTKLLPSATMDALDDRYAKGNTTTDSVAFYDGASDLTIWRKPGAAGSITPVAGGSFTLTNNKLYLRNGWLIGTIDWTRTSGTLTHGDTILTLPTGARPAEQSYGITSAAPATSYIFPVNVDTNGAVVANTPPTGRTSGTLRFAMPVPYDYT